MIEKEMFQTFDNGRYRMGASFVTQDGKQGWYYWAETPGAVGLKGWLYVGTDEAKAEDAFAEAFARLIGVSA